jgi:hypothetical protein
MFEKGLHPYGTRQEILSRQAKAPMLTLPMLGVPCAQTRSRKLFKHPLSRLFNHYRWSTRSVIRTTRAAILKQLRAHPVHGGVPVPNYYPLCFGLSYSSRSGATLISLHNLALKLSSNQCLIRLVEIGARSELSKIDGSEQYP